MGYKGSSLSDMTNSPNPDNHSATGRRILIVLGAIAVAIVLVAMLLTEWRDR